MSNAADVANVDVHDYDDDCRVRETCVDVELVIAMAIDDGNAICARIDWICALATLIEICARAGELYRAIWTCHCVSKMIGLDDYSLARFPNSK